MPPRRRRPRGHIEQLPSGKYRARVYAGRDPLTNKERYLLQTAPTYEAAQKAATQLQRQVDEDQHPKSNITASARRSSNGSRSRRWRTRRASATTT